MNQNQYQESGLYSYAPAGKKGASYYRARAREVLKPSYWVAFGASLLAGILGGTVSAGGSFSVSLNEADIQTLVDAYRQGGISEIVTNNPFIPLMFGAMIFGMLLGFGLRLFVGAPVALGYQRFTLDLVDGNPVTITSIFRYFSSCYAKSIRLRLVYDLILSIVGLPLVIVTLIGAWEKRHTILRLLEGPVTSADIGAILPWCVVIFLLALVTGAVLLWIQYRYGFSFMILAEYPEMRVIDALRNSAHLMRGNKWRFFCLQISFIGWAILAGICTCGIGVFFLAPYMDAASAVFYDDIANRGAAREVEFPSLNPDDYIVD